MSTSIVVGTPSSVEGAVVMNHPKQQLRPDLQEVVADILALKQMENTERFITHKAQREILGKLNANDLAAVSRAIREAEKQQQPVYMRNK